MNNKSKAIRAIYTGKAGEHVVAAQLLLRELNVWLPAYDDGVDLIAENGCRIQVKTARMTAGGDRYTRGIYFYPLAVARHMAVSNSRVEMRMRAPFHEYCDIVVFYGVDENRFWIVPARMLIDVTGLGLGAAEKKRFTGDLTHMREMKSLGYSEYKIGKEYGLQPQQVKQLLADPDRLVVEETVTAQVRRCENAWEHVLDFNGPQLNRNSIIDPTTKET